ncbi:MAG TPA: flagellar biosynthesis protein FlhA [Acidiferrobacterales bacterium]|nr:flagellar biosynthesis protein FlhA [Acidiferrobacterales bacterium]
MNDLLDTMKRIIGGGLGVPLMLVVLLAMMVVPLPPLALDMLFTFNILLSLIVLLVAVYALKPLDFAVFPTVLLLTTLLRLALNVASTRVVLLHGHSGGDAAGQVIKAFGDFVIGGNYAVGVVVFAILVIINFVVVTKGAGRIAEVSARFTLDAMPGKQMAIDADLNAGLLTQDEAKARRTEVASEADFYGAMDGASKFVRGDAVAGILIVFINLFGGLGIGMLQHNMGFGDAMQNYTLLTIGDGLVAQIPSLLLSVAAAILVTRVSTSQDMGKQITTQMFDNPRALYVASAVIGSMGLLPGMPNFAFLTLALAAAGMAYMIAQRRRAAAQAPTLHETVEAPAVAPENRDVGWEDVQPLDVLGLEVGYRLIPLVDKNQGGQLMARIKGVRRKLSQELGFLVPAVHIRDNLNLGPNAYRISLLGVTVSEAEIYPERMLAINPGRVHGTLPGLPTKDPAFGLEALWIENVQRDQAQTFGYTVVDASTVIATHLSQILQTHAHELLGREEVQQLLNNLAKSAPKLVEDLVPKTLPLGTVVKVLQNLLEEKVPIRDIRSIAETLADHAAQSQDAGVLTGVVRMALARSIVQQINGMNAELPVITLDPALEQILQQPLQGGADGAGFEPGLAERLQKSLVEVTQRQETAGQPAVLLVPPGLRAMLARFLRHAVPGLTVLAYNEIPGNKQVRIVATVGR